MVTALTAPKMYIMLLLMPFTISGRTSVKVLEAMSIDPATWNAGDLRATNTPAYNTPAVAHRAACDGKDLSWIEPGDLRGKEHVRWGHAEGHISKTCCQPRGSEDKSIDNDHCCRRRSTCFGSPSATISSGLETTPRQTSHQKHCDILTHTTPIERLATADAIQRQDANECRGTCTERC